MQTLTTVEYKKLRKKRPRFARSPKADRTEDSITFDSKAELERYQELKMLKASGRVRWFIRQPCFDLAGARYHADFLVVWVYPNGEEYVHVEEVKGKFRGKFQAEALRRYKRNATQVRNLYGIEIVLVER